MLNFRKRFFNNFINHFFMPFILIGIFLLFCISGLFFGRWHFQNAKNRTALMKIRENIKHGDSLETVLLNYSKFRTDEIELNQLKENFWLVEMPGEFGATDWRLFISFEQKKVAAIYFRNSDGNKPEDAPNDVGDVEVCGN